MRRGGVAVVVRTQDIDSDVEVVAECDHNWEGTCSDHHAEDDPPVLLLHRLEEVDEAPAAARSILQLMDVVGNDDVEDASDVDTAVDDQK